MVTQHIPIKNEVTNQRLKWNGILFRSFHESLDFEWYYRLATAQNSMTLWRFHGSPPMRTQFLSLAFEGVHCHFVSEVFSTRIDGRVGLLVSYNYDTLSRTAYVGILTNGQNGAIGIASTVMFIKYLFLVWPIRKVYFEMPEFNLVDLRQHPIIKEESRLRSHFYSDGKYWDYLTFAVYRDEFLENSTVNKICSRFKFEVSTK